jgi:hypothetical protein
VDAGASDGEGLPRVPREADAVSNYRGQKPKRVRAESGPFVTCPFCGYSGVHIHNPGRWCAGCFTKYEVSPKWVTFDPNMGARSEGEAWAIALAKVGGARLG